MPKDPDREKRLRRRVHCEQTHLTYLLHLADDPTTVNAEIARRREEVAELKKRIELHEEAIRQSEHQRDNVVSEIHQCSLRLKSLRRLQNEVLITKYLEEYRAINKRIDKEADDADPQPLH